MKIHKTIAAFLCVVLCALSSIFPLASAETTAESTAQAKEVWRHGCDTDEMTDVKLCYASSPLVFGEPFGKTWMLAPCSEKYGMDLFISFDYLNLSGGELNRAGGEVHQIMTRWGDEQAARTSMIINSGSNNLNWENEVDFVADASIMKKQRDKKREELLRLAYAHKRFLIRLGYYNDGVSTIEYSLAGARAAIEAARAGCGLVPLAVE